MLFRLMLTEGTSRIVVPTDAFGDFACFSFSVVHVGTKRNTLVSGRISTLRDWRFRVPQQRPKCVHVSENVSMAKVLRFSATGKAATFCVLN